MKSLLLNPHVVRGSVAAVTLLPSASLATAANCPVSGNNPDTSQLTIQNGANCAQGNSNANSLFGTGGIFSVIADTLIFIVGAVAVIMLIIGGLRYVISQGSKEGVESAKNTILYSIIGIIVAILAYAIVSFVTGALTPPGSTPSS